MNTWKPSLKKNENMVPKSDKLMHGPQVWRMNSSVFIAVHQNCVFILQTWVLCVLSSYLGFLCSFFRRGYHVFVLWTHGTQVWRTNTENPGLKNERMVPKSEERTQRTQFCRSSDFGSLCSFFRLVFSVFVLQTCVLCVRSTDLGSLCLFFRLGSYVIGPKSEEQTQRTQVCRTNTEYLSQKNENRVNQVWRMNT
jgi:hypothetical protein